MSLGSIAETLLDIVFMIFGFTIDIGNLGLTAMQLTNWDMIKLSEFNTIGQAINRITVPIALSLLAIFTMVDLIQKAIHFDSLKIQTIAMAFVKFLICRTIILYSYEFFTWIMDIGQQFMSSVIDALAYNDGLQVSIGATIGNIIDNAKGGITIPIINWSIMPLILFIVFLIIYLPLIGTYVMVIAQIFGHVLKIVITYSFSPIPIALAMEGTGGNSGMRVTMSMISTALEGLIIIICTHIYSRGTISLMNLVSSDGATFGQGVGCMLGILMLNGILITALSSLPQLVDRWIGA